MTNNKKIIQYVILEVRQHHFINTLGEVLIDSNQIISRGLVKAVIKWPKSIFFYKKGIKTSVKVYSVATQICAFVFFKVSTIFQQDFAPGHKTQIIQGRFKANVPNYVRAENWFSSNTSVSFIEYKL